MMYTINNFVIKNIFAVSSKIADLLETYEPDNKSAASVNNAVCKLIYHLDNPTDGWTAEKVLRRITNYYEGLADIYGAI